MRSPGKPRGGAGLDPGSAPEERRRLPRIVAAGFITLFLAVGHWLFWYTPRERPGAPSGGDLPAFLLASNEYDSALWLPYPHQNLGALEEAVGSWRDWLASASRVAGLPPPALPRFGPFAVPPARELTVASSRDGRRLVVAARVYPMVALVARLAGAVAANPWLAGGRVEGGDGQGAVSWRGTLWVYASDGAPPEGPAGAEAGDPPPSLALMRLSRPVLYLPAGLLRLARRQESLELSAAEPGELEGGEEGAEIPGLEEIMSGEGPAVLAWSGAGGPLGAQPTAMFLTLGSESALVLGQGLRLEIPGGSVLWRGAADGEGDDATARRFRLPTEHLPSLLRGAMERGESEGLSIVASSPETLRRAEAWARQLAPLLEGRSRSVGLWVRPGDAYRWVSEVVSALESLPLIRDRDRQPWRDWQTVLAPLSPLARVHLVAGDAVGGFRLRFEGALPDAAPGDLAPSGSAIPPTSSVDGARERP